MSCYLLNIFLAQDYTGIPKLVEKQGTGHIIASIMVYVNNLDLDVYPYHHTASLGCQQLWYFYFFRKWILVATEGERVSSLGVSVENSFILTHCDRLVFILPIMTCSQKLAATWDQSTTQIIPLNQHYPVLVMWPTLSQMVYSENSCWQGLVFRYVFLTKWPLIEYPLDSTGIQDSSAGNQWL